MRRLAALVVRLPEEALTRSTPQMREQARRLAAWPMQTELSALAVELLSVIAAERKIKKPFDVTRPDFLLKPEGEGVKHAVHVLKNTRGKVRRGT